jgi:hypothetical protein
MNALRERIKRSAREESAGEQARSRDQAGASS